MGLVALFDLSFPSSSGEQCIDQRFTTIRARAMQQTRVPLPVLRLYMRKGTTIPNPLIAVLDHDIYFICVMDEAYIYIYMYIFFILLKYLLDITKLNYQVWLLLCCRQNGCSVVFRVYRNYNTVMILMVYYATMYMGMGLPNKC